MALSEAQISASRSVLMRHYAYSRAVSLLNVHVFFMILYIYVLYLCNFDGLSGRNWYIPLQNGGNIVYLEGDLPV